MNKIIKKLKPLAISILKSTSEFLFHTILGLLILAVGGISAMLIFLYDFVLNLLNINLIVLPKHLKLYHLLLLLLIFPIIALINYLFKKLFLNKAKSYPPQNRYNFIEMNGLAWKVNRKTGFVIKEPYCPIHKIKLIRQSASGYAAGGFIYNYYCSDCNKNVKKEINGEDMNILHEMAINKAEQIIYNGKL